MASVFAVVSKKVFETEAKAGGKTLGLGKTWVTSKYKSTVPALNPLKEGGHLFLVTVRPPDEALWLIAVLRDVKAEKDGYSAKPNVVPITDISKFKSKIKFATGSGITAAKGKLGMSLQTPRALTEDDVKLILGAMAGEAPPPADRIWHLNAHESGGPLPCLCKKCLPKAGEKADAGGEKFVRREATAKDRILYYWLPEISAPQQKAVRIAVEKRMKAKLPNPIVHVPGKKRRGGDDDEDDE